MKSAITVFLIGIFLAESLFPNVDVTEVIKLPDLLEHLEKHRQENPDITLLEFFNLHYGDSQHAIRDVKHHHKLPFSKGHHHFYFSFVQIMEIPQDFRSCRGFAFLRNIGIACYLEINVNAPSSGVWQPPKVA